MDEEHHASGGGRDDISESAGPRAPKKGSRFNVLSNPWLIAVLAPVLAAAVLGSVHLIQSSIQNAASPLVSATATYDDTYTWVISSPVAVEATTLQGKVNSCDSMRHWLLAHGGGNLTVTLVRLHLLGTQSGNVTIDDVHAQVLSRVPASTQAIVGCPSAGTVATPQAALNLRDRIPIATSIIPVSDPNQGYVPGTRRAVWIGGRLGQPYFAARVITLAKGESFDIPITAYVTGSEVIRWKVVVDVEAGNAHGVITASGPVFVTAPLVCDVRYKQYLQWGWELNPARLEASQYDPTC